MPQGVFVMTDQPGLLVGDFVEHFQLFVECSLLEVGIVEVGKTLAGVVDIENSLQGLIEDHSGSYEFSLHGPFHHPLRV